MCFVSWLLIIIFHPVFKPEELRQALMPTLEALYRQDPESLPFRQPVNPMLLGIPVSACCSARPYSSQIRILQSPLGKKNLWLII